MSNGVATLTTGADDVKKKEPVFKGYEPVLPEYERDRESPAMVRRFNAVANRHNSSQVVNRDKLVFAGVLRPGVVNF